MSRQGWRSMHATMAWHGTNRQPMGFLGAEPKRRDSPGFASQEPYSPVFTDFRSLHTNKYLYGAYRYLLYLQFFPNSNLLSTSNLLPHLRLLHIGLLLRSELITSSFFIDLTSIQIPTFLFFTLSSSNFHSKLKRAFHIMPILISIDYSNVSITLTDHQ